METTKPIAIAHPVKQEEQSAESTPSKSNQTIKQTPQAINQSSLTTRFRDICNTDRNQLKVTIVGAGSTGSNVALLLARLGIKDITIYDDDVVEDHNLGHQMFFMGHIDSKKVDCVAEICKEAVGVEITTHDKKTDGKEINTDILILCADSMKARKEISANATYQYCIDGRMGGQTFNIFSFSVFDKGDWEKSLYSDEDASPAPCGAKAIGYVSALCSGLMVNQVKKMINGEDYNFELNFCTVNNYLEASNN